MIIAILGGVGSAVSPQSNFSALLGTRALCGFGFGGMMSVGTASVNDMFFLHERGAKTGVYSIFVTNGAHVAALSEYLYIFLHYFISSVIPKFLGLL
jgi:MFS family permease